MDLEEQMILQGTTTEKRAQLNQLLQENVAEVTFVKVDGTVRTMPVTLKKELLPPARAEDPVSQKRVRELNEAVMVAWCTDKKEWRSFRVDNVTDIGIITQL
jgi:WYL_2, Sm-like SH3 beta-barrel fold